MKFSRKELERLSLTEEEICTVLAYQKVFPILVDKENELETFCINARTLWEQLDKPYTQFTDWIKKKWKPYEFEENLDYITNTTFIEIVNGNGGTQKKINYMLTIDMAKQLAMIDKGIYGKIARRYFILMEKVVKLNKEWYSVRHPEKELYKEMSEKVNEWTYRLLGRSADNYDYAREADMLNGKKSAELKIIFGCSTNELLRDYLYTHYNKTLLYLQNRNIVMLEMDMAYEDRYDRLNKMFTNEFGEKINVYNR